MHQVTRITLRVSAAALAVTFALHLSAAQGAAKKKKVEDESEEATPAPRKKAATGEGKAKATPKQTPRPEADEEDEPKPKQSASTPSASKGKAKKPATPAEDEKVESKPSDSPKKKATPAPATPTPVEATPAPATPKPRYLPVASLATANLLAFDEQPPKVQRLIEAALALTQQNLTYIYGSADPANGGMDCSGAIYYLLRQQGLTDVARDASGQYTWARKHGQFFAVVSKKPGGFEFSDLAPGDLLFWNGTYSIDRDPPVTHTMIYLGIQRGRGQHVMWGSSDGRTYDGKPRNGVSVFDFKMPRTEGATGEGSKADFLGYARIPGLRD